MRNLIYELLCELHTRKRFQCLKLPNGPVLKLRTVIARHLAQQWDGISKPTSKTVAECIEYLRTTGAHKLLQKYGKALFRPLSLPIVEEALKRLHSGRAPGLGGFLASVPKAFSLIFAPKIYSLLCEGFGGGGGTFLNRGLQLLSP